MKKSDNSSIKVTSINPNDTTNNDQPYFNQKLDQTKELIQIPQSIYEILFPHFEWKCQTTLIVIIFLINFIVQQIIFRISSYKYYGCVLYELGAFYTADIVYKYEFYRYLVAPFYFGSIYNGIINLLTMSMLNYTLEKQYGKIIWIINYNGGIFGLAFSGITYVNSITTGSCGIIFTILTLYASILFKEYKNIENGYSRIALFIVIFLVNIFIIIETQSTNISICAAGIINGILISFILNYKFNKSKLNNIKYALIIFLIAIEILMIGLIMSIQVDYIDIKQFC